MLKHFGWIWLVFLLAACAPQVQATEPAAPTATAAATPVEAQPATYSDPFSYCAAVGAIDQPDARYTGPETPETVVRGLMQASGAPSAAPLDAFQRGTFWRCMDGQVYACFVGANLPCESQANTSQEPTAEMNEFCAANPGSEFIPAYITGHATIFAWACQGEIAVTGEQVFQVDARGYILDIWYPITP